MAKELQPFYMNWPLEAQLLSYGTLVHLSDVIKILRKCIIYRYEKNALVPILEKYLSDSINTTPIFTRCVRFPEGIYMDADLHINLLNNFLFCLKNPSNEDSEIFYEILVLFKNIKGCKSGSSTSGNLSYSKTNLSSHYNYGNGLNPSTKSENTECNVSCTRMYTRELVEKVFILKWTPT